MISHGRVVLDLDKQLHQCRRGMSRLIDAYTGGFLDKDEFEPRIAHLKERRRALENKIQQRNDGKRPSKASCTA
jgi:hypothetical protein